MTTEEVQCYEDNSKYYENLSEELKEKVDSFESDSTVTSWGR